MNFNFKFTTSFIVTFLSSPQRKAFLAVAIAVFLLATAVLPLRVSAAIIDVASNGLTVVLTSDGNSSTVWCGFETSDLGTPLGAVAQNPGVGDGAMMGAFYVPPLVNGFYTVYEWKNGSGYGGCVLGGRSDEVSFEWFNGEVTGVTRIISVEPFDGEVVATSTPTEVSAEIFVSSDDFEDDMFVEIKISNNAQVASLLVGPIFSLFQENRVNFEFESDIGAEGFTLHATSTEFEQIGRYTMVSSIKEPGFFGLYTRTLVSTTTSFIVGTSTAFDLLQDGDIAGANEIITTNPEICDDGLSILSPRQFIACLFFFDTGGLSEIWDSFEDGVLTKWPFGYVTRFAEILVSSSTVALPSINYEFGDTSFLSGYDLSFDPFSSVASSSNVLNVAVSDQDVPKSVWEIMEQIITILVYLTLAFMIIHDLTNIHKHHHRK